MKIGKEQDSKELFIGIGVIKPLIFNPNRSSLAKILGNEPTSEREEKPEFEYFTKDFELKDRNTEEQGILCDKLSIVCWVEEQKTKKIFPLYFNIFRTPEVSSTGKKLFLSQHGRSMYCDSKENLKDNFIYTPGKIKEPLIVREAMMGEKNYYNFLMSWLKPSNFDVEATLFPDNEERFWKGDMSEVNGLIEERDNSMVMANFYIQKVEKDLEIKQFQRISNTGFCNSGYMSFFRQYTKDDFNTLDDKTKVGKQSMYDLWKFLDSNFGDYGIKREYKDNPGVINHTSKVELTTYTSDMKVEEPKQEVSPYTADYN